MNPKLPLPLHVDVADPVVEPGGLLRMLPPSIPSPILNFDGIPFPGVGCNCAPPDTVGAVGPTQYVQMVNEGYQVFNKTTGASVLGPTAISSIWTGFGGVCQNNGSGDPVVLYDRMANRWLISQFAGISIPTDECIAISTTSDATGTYNRYAFHLGTNFFDYPHLGVWPDGYYMAMNVFNCDPAPPFSALRPSPLTARTCSPACPPLLSPRESPEEPVEPTFLPSDLDGSILPTAGTGNPFVSFPGTGTYKVRLFHADFVTPANTTFNLIGSPACRRLYQTLSQHPKLCAPGGNDDQIGRHRRPFDVPARLSQICRRPRSGCGKLTVSAGGVAGVRWFELRNVTTAPTVFQQSTYQPDTTWRWMGSAAMDQVGNLAIGFSASSAIDQSPDPLRGPARDRSPKHFGPGRSHSLQWNRQPNRHRQPLGRLQRT